MKAKELITSITLGIIGAFLLIGLFFGAVYQQSLREAPLTVEELSND